MSRRYTFALLLAPSALLSGCNLSAAQWSGIAKGALTFACSTVQPFVPAKNAALASTICTDASIAADALGNIIDGAIDVPPPGVHVIHPQGEIAGKSVTCAGGVVAVVPPGIAAKVQSGLDARAECHKP